MSKKHKELPKNKLKKFADLATYPHVIQPELNDLRAGFSLKGKWKEKFFKNQNPIVLELGCGKGEYSLALAKKYSDKNFIGVDIKGARIWDGATRSLNLKLQNIGFLRIRIDWIDSCFDKNEVDEIWITFPDPQIKKRRGYKRLTHPVFLERYKKITSHDTLIHLKTDSQFLYGFTLGVIANEKYELEDCTNDLYASKTIRKHMDIKTHYEKIYLSKGLPITYLRFRLIT